MAWPAPTPKRSTTSDGPVKGTLVPITLANGRQGQLFIPQKKTNDTHAVYVRDEQGLHPVQLEENVSRDELARSPASSKTKPEALRGRTNGPGRKRH